MDTSLPHDKAGIMPAPASPSKPGDTPSSSAPALVARPADVPVFGCTVYVLHGASGVQARLANLQGLSFTAPTEREALSRLVQAFKKLATEHIQSGQKLAWIDPPPAAEPGEQKRFVPVHL